MKFRLPRLWVLGVPGTPPFSEELSDPFSTMVPGSGSGGGRLGGNSCSRLRRDGELLGVLRPEWGVVLRGGGKEEGDYGNKQARVWKQACYGRPTHQPIDSHPSIPLHFLTVWPRAGSLTLVTLVYFICDPRGDKYMSSSG